MFSKSAERRRASLATTTLTALPSAPVAPKARLDEVEEMIWEKWKETRRETFESELNIHLQKDTVWSVSEISSIEIVSSRLNRCLYNQPSKCWEYQVCISFLLFIVI